MEIREIKKENGMGGLGKPAAKMPIAEGGLIGRNVKNCNGFCIAQAYYPVRILSASYNDLNEDGRKIQNKIY